MITISHIEQALARHIPELMETKAGIRAAVALIVNATPAGPRVLFIQRALNENDPWSGNICFPGGKVENGDGEPRLAAERETIEETGLDLREGRCLGRLSDVVGARIPIHVSCFVYELDDPGQFLLMDEEVRDAFWIPLAALMDPLRRGEKLVRFDGSTMLSQGLSLPHEGEPVLWGLTYMLIMDFLRILEEGETSVQP